MRIFLSGTSLKPHYGGLAFSVAQMALALSRAGLDVGLWSADGSALDTPLLPADTPLMRLHGTAAKALAEFRPDIVHDNGLWLPNNHRIARICGVDHLPRIISPHGMLDPWSRRHKKWKKDVAWLAYQRHDIVTAQGLHATSTQEAENLAQINLGIPVHLIPHSIGLPAARKPSISQNVRTALFMGRLHPVKGLPLLLEAWARQRPQSWRLVLAGPDEAGHRAELESIVATQGLGDVVTFVGPIAGAAKEDALSNADLFVLPSHSENFGLAIAEALAHGLPVLTTVGVPWSALTRFDMGWCTPISIDGLAAGLADATGRDISDLRAMGARGRAYVAAEFGWEKVSQQFLAMYTATISKGNSSKAAAKIGHGHRNKGIKVFLCGTSLAPRYGGPAYSVSHLALALSRAGAQVALWSADGSVMDTPLLADNVPITRLTGTAKEAIERFRPDIVHDNGLWLSHNHHLADVCHARGLPRLVSTRGMLEPWARRHKKWKKDIAWLAYQRRDILTASGLHATATAEADNLARLKLGVPVHMIPNGVDIPRSRGASPAPAGKRTALFLGRLYPVKGLPLLIEAWNRQRPSGWNLVLAGPDEAGHKAELESLVARYALSDVITFAGPLDGRQKEEALFNADLFVLPSHSESFGMAIGEALAHGLPVLTTMAAPWPSLTEMGLGWRTSVSVEGLADGLAQATGMDTASLRAMGERGRSFVSDNFGWDNIAHQFLATYAGILAKSTGLAA